MMQSVGRPVAGYSSRIIGETWLKYYGFGLLHCDWDGDFSLGTHLA